MTGNGLTAATTALFDAPLNLPAGGASKKPSSAGSSMPRRKSAKPALPDISENEFLAQIRALAKLTGWEFYHTHTSKFSEAGWPDAVLASAKQRRTLFVELKTRTGTVSKAQQKWLELLAACGHETAVWRPADMPEIAKILRGQRIGGAE